MRAMERAMERETRQDEMRDKRETAPPIQNKGGGGVTLNSLTTSVDEGAAVSALAEEDCVAML